MAKRIVSGIFVLTALGALGVILAGAMTSGEQLIVRFLTAVTVAALALYVISDLRLQNEQVEPLPARPDPDRKAAVRPTTTAVMASVTGSHRIAAPEPAGSIAGPPQPARPASPIRPDCTLDPADEVSRSRLVPPVPGPAYQTGPPPSAVAVTSPATEVRSGQPPTPPMPPLHESPMDSPVIANTSFVYSGKLESDGDWPPKPSGDETDRPRPLLHGPAVDDDLAELIDVPTTELPTLPELAPVATEFDRAGEDAPGVDATLETEVEEEAEQVAGKAIDEPAVAVEVEEEAEQTPDKATGETGGQKPRQESVVGAALGRPGKAGSTKRLVDAARYATPVRPDLLDLTIPAPAAKPEPRPSSDHDDRLAVAIRSGELQVINSLISQGMLSTDGPITDRDVRTMVYVAFTSNELRKLILAGGTPDGVQTGDLNLGPVELFDESRFAPTPIRLYSGAAARADVAVADLSDPLFDLTEFDSENDAAGDVVDKGPEPIDLTTTLPSPKNLYRRPAAEVKVDQ